MSNKECQTRINTDVEIWREKEGDPYSPSIHVTQSGGIGINAGGFVIVAPIRKWHDAGSKLFSLDPISSKLPNWKRKLAYWLLGWK